MQEIIQRLSELTLIIKVFHSIVIGVFASMLSYLSIDKEAMYIYFILLGMDLVTGVVASFIVYEAISIARFYAGILSKFMLFIVPIVVALIVKIQGDSLLWFIKWTVIVLAVSEGISIFNNVQKSRGKAPLPEFDAISMIGSKLRVVLERLFDTAGGKKND